MLFTYLQFWGAEPEKPRPIVRDAARMEGRTRAGSATAPKTRQLEETKRRGGSHLLRRGGKHPSFPDAEWGWAVR